MTQITTMEQFREKISTLAIQSELMAASIHSLGLFALTQANIHNQITPAKDLLEAIGKKHSRERVKAWLCHFGKMKLKEGEIVFNNRRDILPENVDAWLARASEKPYWELTQETPAKVSLDLLTMLGAIIKKAEKAEAAAAEGKEVEIKHSEALASIRELYATLAPAPVAAEVEQA